MFLAYLIQPINKANTPLTASSGRAIAREIMIKFLPASDCIVDLVFAARNLAILSSIPWSIVRFLRMPPPSSAVS
jgi:hypothetical protein